MLRNLYSTFCLILVIVANPQVLMILPRMNYGMILWIGVLAFAYILPLCLIIQHGTQISAVDGASFVWLKHLVGNKAGFWCAAAMWFANLIWYPSILLFALNLLSAAFELHLNNLSIILLSILSYFIIVLINILGIKLTNKIAIIGCVIGGVLPLLYFAIHGAMIILDHSCSEIINLIVVNGVTNNNIGSIFLTLNLFVGLELAAVHHDDLLPPRFKLLPFIIASIFMCVLFSLVAIALGDTLLIYKNTGLDENNVITILTAYAQHNHMSTIWLRFMCLFLAIASFCSMVAWMLASTRILQIAAANCGLQIINRTGYGKAPTNLVYLEGILVLSYFVFSIFFRDISSAVLVLLGNSSVINISLYLILFIVFQRLQMPVWQRICLVTGTLFIIATILLGCLPPDLNFNLDSLFRYEGSLLVTVLLAGAFVPQTIWMIFKQRSKLQATPPNCP